MPRKAPRPCKVPRCPNLVHGDRIYCEDHEHLERARKARADARRGTAAQRGYGAGWQKRRAQFLARHPVCEECGRPATVAHHIVRKRDGGSDRDHNLRALCASCHSRLHAETGESF